MKIATLGWYVIEFIILYTVLMLLHRAIKKFDDNYPQQKDLYMLLAMFPYAIILHKLVFITVKYYLKKGGA
jgi:hypothetical protein